MAAMVAGILVGILLSPSGFALLKTETAERVAPWIALPGNLFLSMIKMVVIPLVLSSIISQVYGVDLGFLSLLTLILTTVGASIGTPSTPGGGVILATILQGIGIPPSGIALIIGVDRIIDMSRTAVNVTGDLVASVVMNGLLRGSFENRTF